MTATARGIPLVLTAVLVTACGGGEQTTGALEASPTSPATAAGDWEATLREAERQRVRWWLFGGDERVNRYIDEHVVPAAEGLGVALDRVPVDDTADAVQRVVAEKRAGREEGGSVDLIWINGENFAQGKEANLWLEDWARDLPNAEFVDWDDPTINTDFGVPVDGEESPWSRAVFVFAHDQQRTPRPPGSYEELLEYARANPGRVTYPAPPDFTGSAFVRQAIQALGDDEAFRLLQELKPLQWREGEAFPSNEAELNRLFGDGQADFAMSYDPAFVETAVANGTFPDSARPFVFETGALRNTSYVTIPYNAGRRAGALVVADLLLRPDLQALKADPDVLGIPTVLDVSRLPEEQRSRFAQRTQSPYLLSREEFGEGLREFPAQRVPEIEDRWEEVVLR
ncbi:MAG: ABC transporter substrate-binding protein [Actinomycetota bacterium]|nr:ABC transporter substrate-binding protein [Actinomycetota bacterium]